MLYLPLARVRSAINMHNFAVYKQSRLSILKFPTPSRG